MYVNPKILKAHGCTSADWEPLFNMGAKKLPQIKRLEYLIQSRIQDGRLMNLAQYRPFAAIDLAYDAPFAQTTPTIVQDILATPNLSEEKILAKLKNWNIDLDELFLEEPQANGTTLRRFNPPTFYRVLVPLVRATVATRWAKLFNERNQSPLLKYEPLHYTAEARILCEIITDVMQRVSMAYGYPSVLRQMVFNTLMYSFCVAFPREAWHTQYQMEEDGLDLNGDPRFRRKLQSEGIRYECPHPTQVSWDLNYAPSTLNTDTGCEWGQYWKVVRYGDILDNPAYWNRRTIAYGNGRWMELASNFLQEIYPCQLEFPTPRGLNLGTNREDNAAYYATSERDKAVFLTDHFMRLIPKKWKLGTYPCPIWVRFQVASDTTVIFAEPLSYRPMTYFGYDADMMRSRNASLALEALPFQDIVGNTLRQILLTIKQNLANVTFYDTNVLSREDVDELKNRGETLLRGLNFKGYDSTKNRRAGIEIKDALHGVKMPVQDVTPLFASINTTLSIMERLLQLSAQEAASAGPHQQSVEEVKLIGNSSTNRVRFTGGFIDQGIDAWKSQLYEASRAYMDSEVESYVPSDIPDIKGHLERLGFTVTSEGEGKIKVQGNKRILSLDAFSASSQGPERKNDAQTAQIIMQAVIAVANNQMLSQALGAKPLLKLLEQASKLAGADKDFKLRPDQQHQMDQLQQLAQSIQAAAVKQIEQDVTKPVAQDMAKIQGEVQQLQQALTKLMQTAAAAPPAPSPVPRGASPIPIPIPNAPQIPTPPVGGGNPAAA